MAGYDQPFIVKKIKKSAHAHHGGAWKIAYADFVTAMMAFFLLLWLISMTTPEQKKGIADYFAPPNVSASDSGAGGVFGGTAMDQKEAKLSGSATDAKSMTAPENDHPGPVIAVTSDVAGQEQIGSKAAQDVRITSTIDQDFHSAAASIRQAWQADPDVSPIADNLLVQQTAQGLDIEIMDQRGHPMFAEGSKYPFEVTRKAIAAIAPILQRLSNQIEISGYTAAGGTYDNPRYGAWELSMDRANTVRQILGEFGLSDDHISSVKGRAATAPMFPNDPYLPGNERVAITVLYTAPPVPPNMAP
jgi:chemotaxis protein MotB